MGDAVIQHLLEGAFLRLQIERSKCLFPGGLIVSRQRVLKHLLQMVCTCSVYMPTMCPCSVASLLKAKLPDEASWGRWMTKDASSTCELTVALVTTLSFSTACKHSGQVQKVR